MVALAMPYSAAQAVSQTAAPQVTAPQATAQQAPVASQASSMQPAPSSTAPSSPPITVDSNGYIHGIDGMLDQISGALLRQARTEILPTLQNDRALQTTIGRAAGKALAKPLWVIAGIAAVYVGWTIWQSGDGQRSTTRANPTRRRSYRQRYYR